MKSRRIRIFSVTLIIVAEIIVAAFIFIIPKTKEGVVALHEDQYFSLRIEFLKGDVCRIKYSVTLHSGPLIDVFFMEDADYHSFKLSNKFNYIADMSVLGCQSAKNEILLGSHGIYYIVIDNTDYGTSPPFNGVDDVAYIDYVVNWKTFDRLSFFIFSLVFLVTLGYFVNIVTKRKG